MSYQTIFDRKSRENNLTGAYTAYYIVQEPLFVKKSMLWLTSKIRVLKSGDFGLPMESF